MNGDKNVFLDIVLDIHLHRFSVSVCKTVAIKTYF